MSVIAIFKPWLFVSKSVTSTETFATVDRFHGA